METISRTHPDETLTGARTAEVEAFLDTLKTAQTRYLDSLRKACSLLNRSSGQLAHVAATHSRLTQQFFDAQRLILTRRAEFDVEFAAIAPDVADATVIDEPFEPHEHDGVTLQRQLASVLDGWWRAENDDGRAMLELAEARAARRARIVRIEAAELVTPRRRATDIESSPTQSEAQAPEQHHAPEQHQAPEQHHAMEPLPPQIASILDQADSIGLDSLLVMLADSLEPPRTGFAPPQGPPVDLATIPVDRSALVLPPKEIGSEDAFRDFWSVGSVPGGLRRTFRWPKAPVPAVTRPTVHDGC